MISGASPGSTKADGPAASLLSLETESERVTLSFLEIAAFSFREFYYCDPKDVGAYDVVVKFEESEYLEKLARSGHEDRDIAHYRLFHDDIGCFDVAANRHAVKSEKFSV